MRYEVFSFMLTHIIQIYKVHLTVIEIPRIGICVHQLFCSFDAACMQRLGTRISILHHTRMRNEVIKWA